MFKEAKDIDNSLTEKKEQLEKLFEIKLNSIFVAILPKSEFKKLKQKDWVIGFCEPRKNLIFVLKQDETGRTYEEWLKIIVHEMTHIFYLKKFKTDKPAWFFEGLACYIAGQKKKQK